MELITHSIGPMNYWELIDNLFDLVSIASSNKNVRLSANARDNGKTTIKDELIVTNKRSKSTIFILRRHEEIAPSEFSQYGKFIVSITIDKDYNFEKDFPELCEKLQELKIKLK